MDKSERNAAICRMREQGYSLREIGRVFELSHTMIRAIVDPDAAKYHRVQSLKYYHSMYGVDMEYTERCREYRRKYRAKKANASERE